MNLSTLQTFLAIIETGNLNRAADQLKVTQSTVTARLNVLEQEIGQVLFHRRKSGAELTAAGFRFERYAQLMTELWRQARQETALPQQIETVCNIGCPPDLWPHLGEPLFNRIRDIQPNIAISAWPGEQVDIDRWLGNGLVDMALCHIPTLRENCSAYSLAADILVLVSTRRRSLVRWDPGYIYVDYGEVFRKNHAAAYPGTETPTIIIGSAVWACSYLLTSGGSAYLPYRLIEKHLRSQLLHVVSQAPRFDRRIYLVVRNDAVAGWSWLAGLIAELSAITKFSKN